MLTVLINLWTGLTAWLSRNKWTADQWENPVRPPHVDVA